MTLKKIKITTDFIKLDQLLKLSNIVSNGGEAKYLILDGKVKYNGEIETRRGKKIYPGDVVEVNGEKIEVE
ncbi:S4 domain-containing protein YaaA [Fusobacterium sp. PH5-44]|uniref:S4 domain-containing protein YaaA n=1 Tax=unclassified Fusobacterium TaxID=2648384 RepID=UPI003D19B5C0